MDDLHKTALALLSEIVSISEEALKAAEERLEAQGFRFE
jgi:hypothetical protein